MGLRRAVFIRPKWIGADCQARMRDSGFLSGYHHFWLYRHPSGVFGVPWLTASIRWPFVRVNISKKTFDLIKRAKQI